jgi:hypothetical protein
LLQTIAFKVPEIPGAEVIGVPILETAKVINHSNNPVSRRTAVLFAA